METYLWLFFFNTIFARTICSQPSPNVAPQYSANSRNASLGEYPHMAVIGYKGADENSYSWLCGGSLISENYVLTSAHCLRLPPVVVRLGTIDLDSKDAGTEFQDIPIAKSIIHPEYNNYRKRNDIALLELSRAATLSKNVRPICLYSESDVPVELCVTGWGATERDGPISRFLLQIPMELVDIETCNKTYYQSPSNAGLTSTQFCAWNRGNPVTDACQGFGGAPIQVRNEKLPDEKQSCVVGIVSFGKGCGNSIPGVYTKVSAFINWIESNVRPK